MQRQDADKPSFLTQYLNRFSGPSAFEDLLLRSKVEAEKTGVDFMSLSMEEVYLFKSAVDLLRPSKGSGKWVEIGALTGFTAVSLFEVLGSEGRLWTMEKDPARATFLRDLFSDERLGGRIQVLEGDSRESKGAVEKEGPFEGVFIDGAKGQYFEDLKWAEANVEKGGLIIADNIFLRGDVFHNKDAHFSDKQRGVMREYLERVSNTELYKTIILPTSDGMSVSRKLF